MFSEPAKDTVIRVSGVDKCYQIYERPADRLKQALFRGRRQYYRDFWALSGIDLEIGRGESFAIVGRNGSGKSTLLQLIAGTLQPSAGEVHVEGRIGALLELGSGFNPEFTGRENVYMQGAIIGFSRAEVEERFDDIAAFADIGDFIEQPVKTYSSGMFVRLAFAVQAQLHPEILIVDEALAVGDALFQKRCFQKLDQLRSDGVTFLFVSHDQEAVRTLTDRALLLEAGKPVMLGSPAEVLLRYRGLLHEQETQYYGKAIKARSTSASAKSKGFEFGDLEAEIESVDVLNEAGEPASTFAPGDALRVRVAVKLNEDLNHLHVFVRLRSKEGLKIYSWGTFNQDMSIWSKQLEGETLWDRQFKQGERLELEFSCDCRLGSNWYEIQAGVAVEAEQQQGSQRILHWRDECAFFQVMVSMREHFFGGCVDLQMKANVTN